jgi:C_GCAxxG_C_C family probable redox protein
MLKDMVEKFYSEKYNLNCSETMIYAANEEYHMKLDKKTLKTMAAFGGGMGVESVCGVISGSLAVIGILFTKERSHESEKIKSLAQEFFKKFEDKLGTSECKILKEKYRNDEIRCSIMVDVAADILDEIVKREMKTKK